MLTGGVVWAIIFIKKLTSCLTYDCLCTAPFTNYWWYLFAVNPLMDQDISSSCGKGLFPWVQLALLSQYGVEGKERNVKNDDQWCLLLNNVFTQRFQTVACKFGHPALDTQSGKQKFQRGTLDPTVQRSPHIAQIALSTWQHRDQTQGEIWLLASTVFICGKCLGYSLSRHINKC